MTTKIVHIINSLEFGGAEMMLCNLLARTDRDRFDPTVILLIDDLTLADRIEPLGVPIRVVGMKPGVPDPRGVVRLAGLIRHERPGLVQTWMDHSNLIGGLAARLAVRAPLVWGVHHSNHVRGIAKRTTLLTVSACSRLSRRVPTKIVCCSEHSRSVYTERGFADEKIIVIPNGIDASHFRPDPSARADVRRELGLGPEVALIGLVARYDPLKDHANFLRAAGKLRAVFPDVHFLLCGENVVRGNPALASTVDALALTDRCHLLGPRRDVARIQASLDIATSSSLSEAFPLTVGEAMACGVSCVVTDVGDSARMVGRTGRVVPAGDPGALAEAWHSLLDLSPEARRQLGLDARRRNQQTCDLSVVVGRYEALYEDLLASSRPASLVAPVESSGDATLRTCASQSSEKEMHL
jgi:glycosyltransferase involved in cell wall biosynthesis